MPISSEVNLSTAINYYPPKTRPKIPQALELAISEGTPWDLQVAFVTAKNQSTSLAATGYAEFRHGKTITLKGDRECCLAAGMSSYLAEPIRLNTLRIEFAKWITAADRS
ncbi:MAG: CheY-like chemotaxis protein [Paraglaciecola sp.]